MQMKKIKTLLLSLASMLCLGCFTACSDTLNQYLPFLPFGDESVADQSTAEEVSESTDSETSEDVAESTDSETSEEVESEAPETSEEEEEESQFGEGYETITIAEALELCGEPGNATSEKYYIIGTIAELKNPQFGEMTISDETGSIYVYGIQGFSTMEEQPSKGDKVLLYGSLKNYNGTKEVNNDAVIIDFEKAVIDDSAYVEMTIADARTAEKDALVKVTGVVAQITYATGHVPSGVILIDETGSIYVYSNEVAGKVEEGNQITVLGAKDYWILETEKAAAEKFGYNGCNQISDARLLSNDNQTNAFPTAAIEETTIKNMMDTPVTNDITTVVYKVNALVKKVPGSGFTNYIFNDIDGETGSYTYTQCNGGDFGWLDKFDGKICTVYLTVLNAKSTASGCVYRFLPVDVQDEGYVFDTANTAEFAVEYYGIDQFATRYTADPALALNTTVSSELLGFEGATLSYTSSNTDVVYFEEVDGGMVMHCGAYGKATVTVTGAYNGTIYEETIEISVEEPTVYDAITVAEAIALAPDTENVVVKGIVGPSVVNKDGFYLFGEDGSVIAVLVNNTADFVGLEIGHEIVLKGMRERYIKDDANTVAGQTCIVKAEILQNNYGNHAYSTEKFITDKTLADVVALPVTEDHTTSVYVLTVKVRYDIQQYYSNVYLKYGSVEIRLYTSSGEQYSWLKDGEEVVVELAPCNWNDQSKGYVGCVLAVRNADGTKTLNTLNFDKY